MYLLKVTENFSAAHKIDGYEGDCKKLHGHNWKIILTARLNELNKIGLAYDLKLLSQDLRNVIETLDHTVLNDIRYFTELNPTAENIGKYIYIKLKEILPGFVSIRSVEVCESENKSVIYIDDQSM